MISNPVFQFGPDPMAKSGTSCNQNVDHILRLCHHRFRIFNASHLLEQAHNLAIRQSIASESPHNSIIYRYHKPNNITMLFSNKTTLGLVALSTLVASSAATDAVRLGRRNLAANAEQNVEGEDLNGLRKLGKKKEKKGRKTRAPKVKKTRAPKGTTHPKTQKSGKSGKAEGALYVSYRISTFS